MVSTEKFGKNGNGKGHRTPPRLVCFGESIWIKIKEVLKEESLDMCPSEDFQRMA